MSLHRFKENTDCWSSNAITDLVCSSRNARLFLCWLLPIFFHGSSLVAVVEQAMPVPHSVQVAGCPPPQPRRAPLQSGEHRAEASRLSGEGDTEAVRKAAGNDVCKKNLFT